MKECQENFIVCQEVTAAFNNVNRPMEDLWLNIEVRQNRLQDVLGQSQKFQETFEDFLDVLGVLEDRVFKEKPVSAKISVLIDQKKEHDQIYNDILQQEQVFDDLLKKGEEMLQSVQPEDEKTKLIERIEKVKERYVNIKKNSLARQKQLSEELNFTQKFADENLSFKVWLDSTEKRVNDNERVSCEETAITKQLRDVKILQREILECQPKLKSIEELCSCSVSNADVDQQIVKNEYEKSYARYIKLGAQTSQQEVKLIELFDLSQNYLKYLKPINDLFDEVEHCIVCNISVYGVDKEKISREQESLNSLMKKFVDILPIMKDFNDTSKMLADKADSESSEQKTLKKKIDSVNERYRRLRDQLHEKYDQLNDYSFKAKKYNESCEEFTVWFDNINKSPCITEPIGIVADVLRKQLQEVEVCCKT